MKNWGLNRYVSRSLSLKSLSSPHHTAVTYYCLFCRLQLYLPTVDHTEPTEYDLKRAVVFIEAALTKHAEVGGQVYIHCKSGHGRGAAVAFCWLLYHQKLGLEDAQRELAASGRSIRKKLYQQKNITAFYEHSVA